MEKDRIEIQFNKKEKMKERIEKLRKKKGLDKMVVKQNILLAGLSKLENE